MRTPDIVFVVLDAYPRQDTLLEEYGYDNESFIGGLEEAGFEVADSANANYTATHTSMASILNMDYLNFSDGTIDNSDLEMLASVVSGDNPVVRRLKADGYEYIHGAADNWLNRCSEFADLCLSGPRIDQTAFALLTRTPVGPFLYPGVGDPSTSLNLERIDQLEAWDTVSAPVGSGPSFTYLHLAIPHPPLFLDANCRPRIQPNLGGQAMRGDTTSAGVVDLRKEAYVDQIACANSAVMSLMDHVDDDDIIVVASDHGPDSFGSLAPDPRIWAQEQPRERFGDARRDSVSPRLREPQRREHPSCQHLPDRSAVRLRNGCLTSVGAQVQHLEPTGTFAPDHRPGWRQPMSIAEPRARPSDVVSAKETLEIRSARSTADSIGPAWIWVLLQLCALSFHIPLAVISGPQQAMIGVGSATIVGFAVAFASFVVYLVARKLARSGWKALAWTSVAVLFFWHWGGLSGIGPVPDWLASISLFALCLAAVTRYADRRLFRVVVFAVGVTLSGTLLLMMAHSRLTTPDPIVSTHQDVPVGEMSQTPDIVFVVLDAYARNDVLQTVYGYDNADFLSYLADEGFTVPDSANANYGSTHFSITSMLEMEYLAQPGSEISNSDLDMLTDAISGDNEFVELLKSNGYTYIHGDTDHWLNTCGSAVDRCEPGPVIDVTGDALLAGTAVGPFLYPGSGDPTTALNLARLEQLSNWDEFQGDIEEPTFTFLHLVLPHPPLHLDATCQPHPTPLLDGRNVSRGEYSDSELAIRRQAYVAQIECANRAIEQLIPDLDPEAAVVITADHGPDSFQPLSPLSEPRPEQILERFSIFSAIRFPAHCQQPSEDHQLVNTFRMLIGCLTESPMDLLDKRYFIATYGGPVEELKDPDIAADSLSTLTKEQ